jgi:hypothetical protein
MISSQLVDLNSPTPSSLLKRLKFD